MATSWDFSGAELWATTVDATPPKKKETKELSFEIDTSDKIWKPFSNRTDAELYLKTYRTQCGWKLRDYQIEDILRFPTSGFRVLYNHMMGLGKTGMSCVAASVFQKTPVLVGCKAGLKYQWMKQIWEFTGEVAQIINQPDDMILPNVKFYIVSLDMMRKFTEDDWERIGAQSLIIDECQHIKNFESKRTRALRKVGKTIPCILGLSANAIENRFTEYWPVLSILRPNTFGNREFFIGTWVLTHYDRYTGRVKGDRVSDPKLWKQATDWFIIRRKKEDVLTELPPMNFTNEFFNLEKEFGEEYDRYQNEFLEYYDEAQGKGTSGFGMFSNILQYMSKMRHLTGRAKVKTTVQHTIDFLESTQYELTEEGFERTSASESERKITLFTHHLDVAKSIVEGINAWLAKNDYEPVLHYHSGLDAKQRFELVETFEKNPKRRVMVASLLSAGEGLNLQFCSDSVLVERHWNDSKEKQAIEGRFHRMGQTAESVDALTSWRSGR